ncbi:MAG: hypothetical protein CMN30_10645 [Sandaracinus sp.]|nr:hypothetical protein [Sandaracinus sp.]|tara:strand:- start:220 stop:918 length:699 start_codon:yes stop_codon:yes gene_type:complete
MSKPSTGLLVAIAAGGGCLVLLLALLGVGLFMGYRDISARATPAPPVLPAPAAAPGYLRYEHAGRCPNNPELVLERFVVEYPADHRPLACWTQTPRPWSYVTFVEETPEGSEQVTIAWSRGAVTPDLLAQAADDLARQLGAGPTTEVDRTPFVARGGALVRRDGTFTVPATIGPFLPGTYLFRQVEVPGPVAGVNVTTIVPVRESLEATRTRSEPLMRHLVETLAFAQPAAP